MQASTVGTPTASRYGTIFITIELSQKSWLVTLHSPDQDKLSRHQLAGGDHAGLLALIDRIRDRAARALGGVPAVASCYEAGYDGFWLHRLLLAAGITNYVFDPASIAVDQRARRVKTDRIDGETMLRTLMAFLRGEPRVVRIVRVPSAEQEDARRASRERDRLVKEQTAHTNRIKALLRLLGMAIGNPRRRDWLSWLATQRDWQGQAVPPQMLGEIRHEHAADAGTRAARCARQDTGPSGSNPCGGADDRAQRAAAPPQMSRPGVRDDTDQRGVLQGLPQPPRGRKLFRADAQSVAERWHRPRPGHQQGGQSARPLCRNRTGLAMAAASAGQQTHPRVPPTHARCRQAHQARRHRRPGAQAGGGAVALSHDRPRARRRGAQGSKGVNTSTNASASRHLPRSARDGW